MLQAPGTSTLPDHRLDDRRRRVQDTGVGADVHGRHQAGVRAIVDNAGHHLEGDPILFRPADGVADGVVQEAGSRTAITTSVIAAMTRSGCS